MRMDKKLKECSEKLRALVSNVQGAPFPGNMNNELYNIWYEHIQSYAMEINFATGLMNESRLRKRRCHI